MTNDARKKGTLILTEGRSGSNWLGSLTKKTGVLGVSQEWFARWAVPQDLKTASMDTYVDAMIEQASTPNGYFCVKLFPSHMHFFNIKYNRDLIEVLMARYDCNFVSLYRQDRMKQAISYARGIQTDQWTSRNVAKKEAQYDAEMIARCFFMINRAYDYWNSFVAIRNLDITHFVYEDLIGAPQPYVDSIAQHAGESIDEIGESPLKIQRDDLTQEWLTQFQKDLPTLNIVEYSTTHRPYRRDPSNLRRFLTGKAMKPYPFVY